jgi:treble-clef zinc-finger protein
MKPATETELRASFVNCTKGEAKRLSVPRDLSERPWQNLDFLGWQEPGAPERAYLVAERDGEFIGLALRSAAASAHRPTMCTFCLTTHPGQGVALLTARKAGPAGREGNSVGTYICSDLACSLYVRGLKSPPPGGRIKVAMSLEEQIERTRVNLFGYLDRVIR